MADCIVLNCTNTVLLVVNIRKKLRPQHIRIQHDSQRAGV